MCFIGYTPSHHSYLCLNPLNNKVFISQHMILNEEFPFRDNLSTHSLHSSTYPSFLLPIPSLCLPSISPLPSSSSSPTISLPHQPSPPSNSQSIYHSPQIYFSILISWSRPPSSSHIKFVPDISIQSSPSPYHHSPFLDLLVYPPCRQNLLSILWLIASYISPLTSHSSPYPFTSSSSVQTMFYVSF